MDYAEQTLVLSFAGLRQLGFGGGPRESVARSYLAALALVAAAEHDARGYALRSRCDLVPEDGRARWELVASDGTITEVDVTATAARETYQSAVKAIKDAGFELNFTPIRLVPRPELVTIARQSHETAVAIESSKPEEQ